MRRPTALVLTACYGSGHIQAANAIAAELNNKGFNPVVSDLFGESYPIFSSVTQSLLIKSFSYSSFYKWFYYGTNINSKGLAQFSRYLGQKRLRELITKYQPQFIISTFPLHSAPYLIKKSRYTIPVYTVITDYCVHPYWINPLVDHYFSAAESVKNKLINQNINEEQITVSGIPIRSEFEKTIDKAMVFKKFQLSSKKKVITVVAGTHGVLRNVKELCQLLLKNPNHQILAICGNNEELYESLVPLKHVFANLRLFKYVKEIHELVSISSCLITKPGGITLAEAAALQIPLILFKPIHGQESENARYFTEQGAAVISHSIHQTNEYVRMLTNDEKIIETMKRQLTKIHKGHASSVIVDFALNEMNKRKSILI